MSATSRPGDGFTRASLSLFKAFGALAMAIVLAACSTAPPKGAEPVREFDLLSYAGNWYEVARLDNRFERGLARVTAEYKIGLDGAVTVINRGFDPAKGEWKEAIGRARFRGAKDVGSLEVSFFGPFYAGYHIIDLDKEDYAWALVVGSELDYAWLLSREPAISPAVKERLLNRLQALGVDTRALVWVRHLTPPSRALVPEPVADADQMPRAAGGTEATSSGPAR